MSLSQSTFLQRAYDQLIHDVAVQNLPVLFAIDRAGLVGGEGFAVDASVVRADASRQKQLPACIEQLMGSGKPDDYLRSKVLEFFQHTFQLVPDIHARHGPLGAA